MCQGRFLGRIALYWAPSWILLLPFGLIESCSNWQSFTISQHWWRFWGSHSFFTSFLQKDWFWNYSFSAQCVYGLVYLCAFVRIYEFVCVVECICTHIQRPTHTHTCLKASLGSCLNGIRGDYGSCWGDGTVGMTWENTHHTLHLWY